MVKTSFIHSILRKFSDRALEIFSYSWFPEGCREKSVIDTFLDQILRRFSFKTFSEDTIKKFLLQNDMKKEVYIWMLADYYGYNVPNNFWLEMGEQKQSYIKSEFIVKLISVLSLNERIVIIFDDIQWAENSCEILLNAFYSSTYTSYYSLISSSHNVQLDHNIRAFKEINLDKISKKDAQNIIISETNFATIPESLLLKIYESGMANPYYICQISKFIKLNFLSPYDIESNDSIVPETIDVVFLFKLNSLSDHERYITKSASVIGKFFKISDMHILTSYTNKDLIDNLKSLEEKNIIRCISAYKGIYSFTHHLEQKSIHDGLPKEFKNSKHQKYLNFLEKENYSSFTSKFISLSYHAFNSNLFEKSYVYSMHAGGMSLKQSMPEDAICYYNRAVVSIKKSSVTDRNNFRLFRACIGLSKAYCLNGSANQAEKVYLSAKSIIEKLDCHVERYCNKLLMDLKILIEWILYNYDYKKISFYEEYNKNNQYMGASVSIRLACMLSDLGYYKKSNEELFRIIGTLEEQDDDELLFPIYSSTLSDISRNYGELGQNFLAYEYAKDAIASIDKEQFSSRKIYTLTFSASHFLRVSNFEDAFFLLEEAYILTNHFRVGIIKPFVHGQYAYAKYFFKNSFKESEQLLLEIITLMINKNFNLRLSLYHLYLAEIYLNEEKLFNAEKIARQGISYAQSCGDLANEGYLYHLLFLISSHGQYEGKTTHSGLAAYLENATKIANGLSLKPLLEKISVSKKEITNMH